jgi:hypothetical protein
MNRRLLYGKMIKCQGEKKVQRFFTEGKEQFVILLPGINDPNKPENFLAGLQDKSIFTSC